MFSDLINVIFPKLGESFGILSYIATLPTNFVLDYLEMATGSMTCITTNLFTGELFSFVFPSLGGFGEIFNFFLRFMIPTAVIHAPFWVTLVYCSFGLYISLYIVKFLVSIYKLI